MEYAIDKAKVLIEALPYIKEFFGKIIVIKYGGSAMTNPILKNQVIEDIILMKLVGMRPVVVHGGGPEINNALKEAGLESRFIDGMRYTDQATMDIVEMVLAGKVNKHLVSLFQKHQARCVGISGKDGATIIARQMEHSKHDLGFVGSVKMISPDLLLGLLENDFIPLVAPIGCDEEGNSYNINADYAAVAIAGALEAQKIVFLTDVTGVLSNIDDPESRIPTLNIDEAIELIENRSIQGGMLPKVECAIKAVKSGIPSAHILDGRLEHSLLLEIFTREGVGTLFTKKMNTQKTSNKNQDSKKQRNFI